MLYMKDIAPATSKPELIGIHCGHLLRFFGKDTLAKINATRCRSYAAERGSLVSQSTVRRELVTFQAAINHWHRESPLAAVPVITKPAESAPRPRYLTRREVGRLWSAAVKLGFHHVARFILLGFYTGTRHETILRLRWYNSSDAGHVDVEGNRLYRRGEAEAETKKRRPVSRLPDRLMLHIRRWHKQDMAQGPQTAIIRWRGKPIRKERRAWGLVVAEAGLGRDVTPHILRHTCATLCLQSGMELWDVAGLTGMSVKTLEATYGHQDADFQHASASAFIGNRWRKTGTE